MSLHGRYCTRELDQDRLKITDIYARVSELEELLLTVPSRNSLWCNFQPADNEIKNIYRNATMPKDYQNAFR